MEALKILRGTQADFEKIASKDSNAIYFITDTHRIYIGETEFSRPTECVQDLSFIVSNGENLITIDKQED